MRMHALYWLKMFTVSNLCWVCTMVIVEMRCCFYVDSEST